MDQINKPISTKPTITIKSLNSLNKHGYLKAPTQAEINGFKNAADRSLKFVRWFLIATAFIAISAGLAAFSLVNNFGWGEIFSTLILVGTTFGIFFGLNMHVNYIAKPATSLLNLKYFEPISDPTLYQSIIEMKQEIPEIREWCKAIYAERRELTLGELNHFNALWSEHLLAKQRKENKEQLDKAMQAALSN